MGHEDRDIQSALNESDNEANDEQETQEEEPKSDNLAATENFEMIDEKEIELANTAVEKESNASMDNTVRAEQDEKAEENGTEDNAEGKPDEKVESEADILELDYEDDDLTESKKAEKNGRDRG